MAELWAWVQASWGTVALLAGYIPVGFWLYQSRLDLRKIKLEIVELQAKIAERESRIEKVSMADIAKYAPKSSAFDDVEYIVGDHFSHLEKRRSLERAHRPTSRHLATIAALLIVCACYSPIFADGPASLGLTIAADKVEYAAGEIPNSTLTLTNTGSESATVFPVYAAIDQMIVWSVRADNKIKKLNPTKLPSPHCPFGVGFDELKLVTLTQGMSTSFTYPLVQTGDAGVSWLLSRTDVGTSPQGITLKHATPRPDFFSCTYDFFLLPTPGTYRVRVRYKYVGTDQGKTDVFRKSLTSNDLEFTLK